jgi:hypothetical protein
MHHLKLRINLLVSTEVEIGEKIYRRVTLHNFSLGGRVTCTSRSWIHIASHALSLYNKPIAPKVVFACGTKSDNDNRLNPITPLVPFL